MNDEQLLRYSRQIMLPQIDVAGQENIRASTVLIIGLGGLGSPVAMYLAAAGVGRLLLVDLDRVELSNLQRQIIHGSDRLGEFKVESAARTLAALNPTISVETFPQPLDEALGNALFQRADICVDCTDHFAIRFLLNRLAVRHRKPLVSGAAIRMEGQLTVFDSRKPDSPCYRCLYEESGQDDLRCSTNGVLAPVVGVIGSLQATESLKLAAGLESAYVGRLLIWDALHGDFRQLRIRKDLACPICSG
ncbi:Adenylyltransferase [gamma proteobacterium HdN1]|nr:Adenylyltransferase [gamma proteobacterium HdN1]